MKYQFKAVAIHDYTPKSKNTLSLKKGDVVYVLDRHQSGWWDSVLNGIRGWVPSNFLQIESFQEPEILPQDWRKRTIIKTYFYNIKTNLVSFNGPNEKDDLQFDSPVP